MNEVLSGEKPLLFEVKIDMESALALAGALFFAFALALIVYKKV